MNYHTLNARTAAALAQQKLEREAREAEQERERAENKRLNDAARDEYRAGLAAQREAKARAYEAQVDAELTPERARLERQWRADHPDQDARDFSRKAWPALRQNLLEACDQAQMEAGGRYTL